MFDTARARQLLQAAAALPDNPRATGRGPTYHAIFVLCYGLGLRAGEACGLRLGDVDADRQLLVVRGGKFGKNRLVPHGPRIGQLLARQVERRGTGRGRTQRTAVQLRRSAQREPRHRDPDVPSTRRRVGLPGARRRRTAASYIACVTRSPWGVCCGGTARVSTRRRGSTSSPRSWVMSIPTSTAIYLTITPQLLAEANRRFEAFAEPAWSQAKP